MAVRIGINGFGRIGRMVMRALEKLDASDIEVVAVNDLTDTRTLAHLLTYDSVHRQFPAPVAATPEGLKIGDRHVRVLSETDPAKLPWGDLGVDFVLESTGRFTKRADAAKHIDAGAKKVLISAPAKEVDLSVVYGVNHTSYDPARHHVLSNASCTTNCLVPLVKVLLDGFGWVHGFMVTVHAYTNDQRLLDFPHKDLRRARAAALSIIPTTTGAARATALVLPELEGKIDGYALRVPTPDASLVDLTVEVERETTIEAVNDAFRQAAAGPLSGILAATDDPLVSSDFIGDTHSSTVDLLTTNVINGTLVHVASWYDNEMGYSARCVDVLRHMAQAE